MFDIDRVVLTGLHSTDQTGWDTANVHVQFALAGILATEPAFTGRYVLGFDTDANAGTGDASGFERLAQVDVIGDGLGGLSLTGSIFDEFGGLQGNFTPFAETEDEFTDHDNGLDPAATSLLFEIPKSLMGFSATEVPVIASAGDGISFFDVTTDLIFDRERWLDDPTLQTFGNGVPTFGQLYPFAVSGLLANDPFNLYLDDDLVFSDTLDGAGAFSGSFMFNQPVNDIYFLTAQDSTGEFAYSITCVPLPAAAWTGLSFLAAAGAVRFGRRMRAGA